MCACWICILHSQRVIQCKCQHCRHHHCHRFHFYRIIHSVSAFPEILAGHRDNTYETRQISISKICSSIGRKTIAVIAENFMSTRNEWTILNTWYANIFLPGFSLALHVALNRWHTWIMLMCVRENSLSTGRVNAWYVKRNKMRLHV